MHSSLNSMSFNQYNTNTNSSIPTGVNNDHRFHHFNESSLLNSHLLGAANYPVSGFPQDETILPMGYPNFGYGQMGLNQRMGRMRNAYFQPQNRYQHYEQQLAYTPSGILVTEVLKTCQFLPANTTFDSNPFFPALNNNDLRLQGLFGDQLQPNFMNNNSPALGNFMNPPPIVPSAASYDSLRAIRDQDGLDQSLGAAPVTMFLPPRSNGSTTNHNNTNNTINFSDLLEYPWFSKTLFNYGNGVSSSGNQKLDWFSAMDPNGNDTGIQSSNGNHYAVLPASKRGRKRNRMPKEDDNDIGGDEAGTYTCPRCLLVLHSARAFAKHVLVHCKEENEDRRREEAMNRARNHGLGSSPESCIVDGFDSEMGNPDVNEVVDASDRGSSC